MPTAALVECQKLGLRYRLRRSESLKTGLLRALLRPRAETELWPLRDFDMSLHSGECLAVLGRNGVGKSTLCQVLAGVLAPDEGRLILRGRVTALLGIGIGFHEDLSGADNLYRCGAFLGFSRAEMKARFDTIVDFAELGDFMDSPIRHWSSGMQARLGFAIGIETRGEILVLDEVLAVGDEGFRKKCLGRLNELMAESRGVLLVTHDGEMMLQFATRALWLEGGKVRESGPPAEVLAHYRTSLAS